MSFSRLILALGVAASLSACAIGDVPTRNQTADDSARLALAVGQLSQTKPDAAPSIVEAARVAGLRFAPGDSPVHVASIVVDVPRSLKVSEANSYLPKGDIVWRGDPMGDRHQQVAAILRDAMLQGTARLDGPIPVRLAIRVDRFHALSEKARYTTGGVHAITFTVGMFHEGTTAPVIPARTLRADLDAYGGQQALLAEARGETQKLRITAHLAEAILQELTRPEGYTNARLGLMQALNNQ